MPEADVGGAVADAEDPAVAGQQHLLAAVVGGPQLEPGLEVVVVVARARVVGAHGHAHRAVLALLAAHRQGQPRGVAVRGDDQRRGIPELGAGGAALLVHRLGGDAHDGALGVQDRAGDVGGLAQSRTVLDRVLGEDVVEVLPRADQAVGREAREVGPRQGQAHAAADDPQAVVLDPAVLLGRGDAEGDELLDGARGQPVAADLLAREARLLQDEDVQPGHGEVGRGGRSRGTGTDDDDVGGLGGAPAEMPPAASLMVSVTPASHACERLHELQLRSLFPTRRPVTS